MVTEYNTFNAEPGALKTQEWKTWHQVAGVENAGVENERV